MNTPIEVFLPILLELVFHTAAQFPQAGQYAFPQMSGPMPGPVQMQMPPGAISMGPHPTMNLNSPFQIPQQRLPVVVMPYHSKASDRKYRRRKRINKKYKDSSCSSSSSESFSSSREHVLRSKKQKYNQRRKQKRQVLTPVISYITRNGDIVYQKKVKRDKAGDWLELGNRKTPSKLTKESKEDVENIDSQEMTMHDLKRKFDLKSKKHKHRH